MSSTYNNTNGRYVLGGVSEMSAYALEWWERKTLARDPSDILYIIEKRYEGRPDLLGYLLYGDPGLWWVVAQYNGIIDPIGELVEGKLLYVPLLERVRSEMFNTESKLGGIRTTRGA